MRQERILLVILVRSSASRKEKSFFSTFKFVRKRQKAVREGMFGKIVDCCMEQ